MCRALALQSIFTGFILGGGCSFFLPKTLKQGLKESLPTTITTSSLRPYFLRSFVRSFSLPFLSRRQNHLTPSWRLAEPRTLRLRQQPRPFPRECRCLQRRVALRRARSGWPADMCGGESEKNEVREGQRRRCRDVPRVRRRREGLLIVWTRRDQR